MAKKFKVMASNAKESDGKCIPKSMRKSVESACGKKKAVKASDSECKYRIDIFKKDNPDEYKFALEHIKDYFTGNFSEIKEALALRPNNKVKLLYGVRTTDEGKQYQAVCTRGELILRNSAGVNALTKLEKDLANAKQNGAYQNTDYKVQELQEWTVEPTNLEQAPTSADSGSSSDLPWEA